MRVGSMWMAGACLTALAGCSGNKDEGSESQPACPSYTITVQVSNPEGEPMEEATVYAALASDPTQEIDCPGSSGTFTCTITQPDIWKVYSEATSYEPFGRELDLTTDVCTQTLEVSMLRESAV